MNEDEFAGIIFANKMFLLALQTMNKLRQIYPDGVADRVTPEQRAELEQLEAAIVKEMP